MKLKLMACALLALAIGNTAQARIEAGEGVLDPEVFLAVWDASGATQNTILFDTGLRARTVDWNAEGTLFSANVDLAPLGASTNLRYAVITAGFSEDPLGLGIWFTSPNNVVGAVFADPENAGTSILSNMLNIRDIVNTVEHGVGTFADNLQTFAAAGQGSVAAGLLYGGIITDFTTGNFPNFNPVGQALGFYSSIVDPDTFEVSTVAYAGQWLLTAGGLLSYVVDMGGAPIPLPAGFWLLGSALLGLVGVSRRRRALAAA